MSGAVPDDFWVEWHPTRAVTSDLADYEWQRLANPIRELSCTHGFVRDVARVEAGTLIVVFDDRDRSLDPSNSYAPNRGGYTPLRHVRVRATVGATTYTLWRGFTVGWTPDNADGDAWVMLEAKDSLVAAAKKLRQHTLGVAIAALSPSVWLPLDDGGTAVAQEATGQNANMTDTAAAASILPFATQPSTTFPNPGTSKGDVAAFAVPYGMSNLGYTIIAVVQTNRPEAQIILSCGPNPANGAFAPSGDVQLTVDAGNTYSLRQGNASGDSLIQQAMPKPAPSTLIVARYDGAGNTILWATVGVQTFQGATYINANFGGSWSPRAGTLRVGAGLDAANANPFLGALSNVAVWQRCLTDDEAKSIVTAYFGLTTHNAYLPSGAPRTDEAISWVLDRLGIPAARRDLAVGTIKVGGSANDLTALEMMSRAAATEGGWFFADRSGNYVFRLRGAVGTVRGTYDTRPTRRSMTANERGIEVDNGGWSGSVVGLTGSAAAQCSRSTARASAGVASLAVVLAPGEATNAAGATLRRSQWSAVQSSLSDGTVGPWVARPGTATVSNPNTASRSGDNGFLRITAAGGTDALVDADGARQPTTAGRGYRARAYLMGISASRSVQLYWEFYDAGMNLLSTYYGYADTPSGAWLELLLRTQAPDRAKWRRLGVKITAPLAGEGWNVDDVADGPMAFDCRPGQVIDVAAQVSSSVAGKAASAGAMFGNADGGEVALATLPTVTPPTVGFAPITGTVVVPAGLGIVSFAPIVTVTSLAQGETVYFDEIDVAAEAGAALADAVMAHDDRTFFTVARMRVTSAAAPQVVETRHANADIYGEVIFDAPTQFDYLSDAKAAGTNLLGTATPSLATIEAEVMMGAAGVDAAQLLQSDILDQVVTILEVPGNIGFAFHAFDGFLGVSTTSLGNTSSGTGITDYDTWTTHGADTWGKDAAGAYRNGAAGPQQVTINAGVADQAVSAKLWANGDGVGVGVVARWADPNNHLLLRAGPDNAATLYQVVAGVYTALAGPFPGAAGDTWAMSCVGTLVTVTHNGVFLATATTTVSGGVQAGLAAWNTAGASSRIGSFDVTASQLGPEPILQGGTIVAVTHHYTRDRQWRTRWSLVPTLLG